MSRQFWIAVILFLGTFGMTYSQDNPHGEISVPCHTCHTTESWKLDLSSLQFDHAKTPFPLVGQHLTLPCRQCHASLKFSEAPGRCASCHEDIHRGELGLACDRCHTPQSWLIADMPRRHAQTRFPLTGMHRNAACEQCHLFQQKHQYVGLSVECYSCHKKDYQATVAPAHVTSGINTDCVMCHSTQAISWGGSFKHAETGFPLAGAHAATACGFCHQGGRFRGTSRDCYGCHQPDYAAATNPAHVPAGFGTNCVQCHSASATAWGASFNHSTIGFPLAGGHLAASCISCHAGGVFKGTPTACYSCHQNDYAAATNPAHVPAGFGTNCVQCHSASATTWGGSFNHALTGFPLTGGHVAASCISCHTAGRFKGTPTDCYSCHQPDYAATTNPAHGPAGFGTNCVQCHSASATSWGGTFNHAQTAFPLTGAHTTTTCISCHAGGVFKGTSTNCYSCHQQDYAGATNPVHSGGSFPTTCATCHTPSAWIPSTFNHTPYFPISAGARHSPGRWTACSDCHTNPVDYKVYMCLNCHEHAKTTMDSKHAGRANYQYLSSACYSCHPRGTAG